MPAPGIGNGPPPARRISVIVPTLNEQTRLVQALRRRGRLTILPQLAALVACLARSIADASSAPARTIVPSESVAEELYRFVRSSQVAKNGVLIRR